MTDVTDTDRVMRAVNQFPTQMTVTIAKTQLVGALDEVRRDAVAAERKRCAGWIEDEHQAWGDGGESIAGPVRSALRRVLRRIESGEDTTNG